MIVYLFSKKTNLKRFLPRLCLRKNTPEDFLFWFFVFRVVLRLLPPTVSWSFWLSPKKIDFENHRTSTEYEDSLVTKLFCFTFCNSYGGFIYLAFIGEPVVGVACERSCMNLLATNLTIVFVVQLLVGDTLHTYVRRNVRMYFGLVTFSPCYFLSDIRHS